VQDMNKDPTKCIFHYFRFVLQSIQFYLLIIQSMNSSESFRIPLMITLMLNIEIFRNFELSVVCRVIN